MKQSTILAAMFSLIPLMGFAETAPVPPKAGGGAAPVGATATGFVPFVIPGIIAASTVAGAIAGSDAVVATTGTN